MPKRDYTQVHLSKQIAQLYKVYHEPGYNWIIDRFGPPPGIPREEKERLDELSDEEFLKQVLQKKSPEIEALMSSEEERRRSFRSTWEDDMVKGDDLAKAGFYCLNDGDQAKCAFCAVIIAQWPKEQTPMEKHKREASFCSFVKGKAVNNIPFDRIGTSALPKLLQKKDPDEDAKAIGYMDSYWEISAEDEPDRPDLKSQKRRKKTFGKDWPTEMREKIPRLADSGFYMADSEKCSCFQCGGTVEEWTPQDDPWKEHAKWFYKCQYLLDRKGGDYIRRIRNAMTEQELHESENLTYGVTTNGSATPVASVEQLGLYKSAEKQGCSKDCLDKAFNSNTCFCRLDSLYRSVLKNDPDGQEDDEAMENEEAAENPVYEVISPAREEQDRVLYKLAVNEWGYNDQLVTEAYKRNRGREFHSLYKLVKMIYKIADEQQDETEKKTNYQAKLDAQRNWMRNGTTGTDKQENEETEFKFETATAKERPVESKHSQFEDLVVNHRNETISADEIKKAEQLMRRCPSCQQTLNIKYYKPCDDTCFCECPEDPEFCPVCHKKISACFYGDCH